MPMIRLPVLATVTVTEPALRTGLAWKS
jgi:hypothetical protein